MKRFATTLALLAICAAPAFAANAVRISQIYGGGGGTTAATDFVELFNASASTVNIGGLWLEYGSAAGLWNTFPGNAFQIPAGATIKPCSYVLIACNVGSGGAPPIGADYATAPTVFNMSGTNGKVMLVTALNGDGTASGGVACGSEVGTIIDKVSWGSANCGETAAMAALTASTAGFRLNGGMNDTDNNSVDFSIGAPAPRNSQSVRNPNCLLTPTKSSTWGAVKIIYR